MTQGGRGWEAEAEKPQNKKMATSAVATAAFLASRGGSEVEGGAAVPAAAPVQPDREVDKAEDVRTILKRKEEEVKEMLAPEKDMYGESEEH